MGQTFFLQGGTMDGEGYPLTHTTRAAPATVSGVTFITILFVSDFCASLWQE